MGKFIQYDIIEILPTLKEFVEKVALDKEYSKEALFDLYRQVKSYETGKTKKVFSNILTRILFGVFKKGEKKSLNPLGILIKKDNLKENLLVEVIYLDLYNNTEIFRIECEELYKYLIRRGNFSYSKESFEEFIFARVERILEDDENLKENINNTRNKMYRTVKNLIILGAITNKNGIYVMQPLKPDWRLVAYLIVTEFKAKKVKIENIKKGKFKKILFISDYDIEEYLEKMQLENLIMVERRSGLSQININISDPYELVKFII